MDHRDRQRVGPQQVARGLRAGADLLERDRPGLRDVAETVGEVLTDIGHDHESDAPGEVARNEASSPGRKPLTPVVRVAPGASQSRPVEIPSPSVNPAAVLRDGYTCRTPWSGELADVIIVCCSSEKYELQHQELIRALGYKMPHFIQVPGGPAALYSLAVIRGFFAKAISGWVDKVVDLLDVRDVILIAHEDCGAYKSGRVMVLSELTRRLAGKDIKDVQIEHLKKAARDLRAQLGRNGTVHSFYGHIEVQNAQKRIRFEPVRDEA